LRKHGPEIVDGNEVSISGTGSWKTLSVVDAGTGECIIEKKFHKPKFNEIMNNPEYSHYIDDLLEKVMVKSMNNDDLDVDVNSYVEVSALVDSIDDELIDPEG